MLKSKSEFFEQQSKKPEGSYQPEALKKLQELQELRRIQRIQKLQKLQKI